MLKLLLVTMLLGAGTPCFSEFFSSKEITSQRDSLFYLNSGNKTLLSGNSRMALRHFNNAFQFVNTDDDSSHIVDFLISFGQVIAYDAEGDRTLCKQAIGSLILAMQNWTNREERSSSSSSSSSSEDFLELQEFLSSLIAIAPSSDIKDLLTDISLFFIDDLHPYFDDFKLEF